jgi:phosphate transport system substrate-binding protein
MKQLKTLAVIAISLTIYLGLQACTQSANTATESTNELRGKLVLTGSSTVAPLAAEIGKRFESQYPGVRIDVQTGGSSRGIADVQRGVADIGMISRSLQAEEQDLQGFAIARDGISIIIHQDNPVKSLSNQQVVDIYTGKINNWQQVNGNNAPITVVNKAEGRFTLELFLNYFQIQNSNIKASVVIGDNQQGIKTVAGNPNAIGYVSIGTAEVSRNSGINIKLLPLNEIAATTENVQNQTFPLARSLNFVTKTPPQGLKQAFIEFAQSPQVHDIIQQQEFVPISK